jgi:hypothetical protein
MTATSLSIIIPSVFFLIYISENISRYMTIADGILVTIVVVSHWITACIDPGTVYCRDTNLYDHVPDQTMIPVDNSVLEEMVSLDVETGVEPSASAGTSTSGEELSNKTISPLQTTPPGEKALLILLAL